MPNQRRAAPATRLMRPHPLRADTRRRSGSTSSRRSSTSPPLARCAAHIRPARPPRGALTAAARRAEHHFHGLGHRGAGGVRRAHEAVLPPPPRTKWTRRVPHPILIGHAAPLTPYARSDLAHVLQLASDQPKRVGCGIFRGQDAAGRRQTGPRAVLARTPGARGASATPVWWPKARFVFGICFWFLCFCKHG